MRVDPQAKQETLQDVGQVTLKSVDRYNNHWMKERSVRIPPVAAESVLHLTESLGCSRVHSKGKYSSGKPERLTARGEFFL